MRQSGRFFEREGEGGRREGGRTGAHLGTNVPSLESTAFSSFAALIKASTSEPNTGQNPDKLLGRVKEVEPIP